MKTELIRQLAVIYPELKPYQLERCVTGYIDVVLQELAVRLLQIGGNIAQDEFSFAADSVRKAAGRTCIQGRMIYNWSIMQAQSSTAVLHETYRGNSIRRRISKFTLNPKYESEIFMELAHGHYQLTSKYLAELAAKANFSIPVDRAALQSYITATVVELTRPHGSKYQEKLTRNLLVARRILGQLRHLEDGSSVVDEYWEEIDCGRAHGHGVSLQAVAKEVRHAALGRCCSIDFKASSYAILASLALAIDPDLKVGAIRHYITHREIIRKRIARHLETTDFDVKQIFTMMGFGAQIKDNPHTAIRRRLGKAGFDQLVATPEFAEIRQELLLVRDTILTSEMFQGTDFVINGIAYTDLDTNTGKKRTANQKIAWIYQACERWALDIVLQNIPDEFTMLLPVHDCVYLRHQLSGPVIRDLKVLVQAVFPLLDFEQELRIPIHTEQDHTRQQQQRADAEAVHFQHIAQEENKSREYCVYN